MNKKLYIKTYGCQMNVYDSGKMQDVLADQGYVITDEVEDANLIIINTCHIREKAAEKVYSELGRIKKMIEKKARAVATPEEALNAPSSSALSAIKKRTNTIVAVAGCVAQAEGAEMIKRAPILDIVVGSQAYHRLPEMVANAEKAQSQRGLELDFATQEKFDSLMATKSIEGSKTTASSAFVSIQEGCDKFCTYCVVPYTRGAEFSRSVKEVEEETRKLLAEGVQEIYLLGQNVNAYHGRGADFEKWSLGRLIHHLADIDEVKRIRYVTSHPRDVNDELINAHRDVDKLMPFLHLPLQAGSDRILKAMNRQHSIKEYFDKIDKFRKARPDLAFSSDFIVGFPGETEAEFQATLDAVNEVRYASTYAFIYSPRPGTPAALYEDDISIEVKKERLERLLTAIRKHSLDFNNDMVGKTMPILFDRPSKKKGQIAGSSPYLQPVHIDTQNPEQYMNQIVNVKIDKALPNSLHGVIVE